MADEIERKYLVRVMPDAEQLGAGTHIRQGYLAVEDAVEVRIRMTADAVRLTVKAGAGMTRTEVEVDLDAADGEALWEHTAGRRIEKLRHRVRLDDGLVAEVDRYDGGLTGLCTVEVEFPDQRRAEAFEPPPWFGTDVTGDARWSNAELARRGAPQ